MKAEEARANKAGEQSKAKRSEASKEKEKESEGKVNPSARHSKQMGTVIGISGEEDRQRERERERGKGIQPGGLAESVCLDLDSLSSSVVVVRCL